MSKVLPQVILLYEWQSWGSEADVRVAAVLAWYH